MRKDKRKEMKEKEEQKKRLEKDWKWKEIIDFNLFRRRKKVLEKDINRVDLILKLNQNQQLEIISLHLLENNNTNQYKIIKANKNLNMNKAKILYK